MIDYLTRDEIIWLFEIKPDTYDLKWLVHPNFPKVHFSPWALSPYDIIYDGDAVMSFYEEFGVHIT